MAIAIVVSVLSLCGPGVALAQSEASPASASETTTAVGAERSFADIPGIWWVAPIGAVLALVFAMVFYRKMISSDEGDEDMKRISSYVRDGALAYLRQQYKVVAVFFIIVSALLFFMGWVIHVQHQIVFAAFLTGGFWSGLCGWLGMNTATRASHRTCA
ncbi:MAG: sodium/proton-translocating pyrophosphatase, partial [Dehalococcoidia bacterium]